MKEIYDILREFRKRPGQSLALATLVRMVGSSYRRPGARMLVCEDGNIVGSLSAGCLEKEVALRARDVLQNGDPILLGFDTRRRFGCAGKIDILVERVSEEFLAELAMNIDARRACRAPITVANESGNYSRRFIRLSGFSFSVMDPTTRPSTR